MNSQAHRTAPHPYGLVLVAAMSSATPVLAASLTSSSFGTLADGRPVTRYTMVAASGVSVSFIGYGGTVTDVVAPDRHGRPGHVVLGFATLREYETKSAQGKLYFGAILGRFANWIDRGRFTLDDQKVQLTLSDPPNTIHGGTRVFDKQLWAVQPLATAGASAGERLDYTSRDGEEGYPGNLQVAVTYTLSDDGAFTLRYQATTDRKTVVNLSNHMNFDLAGAGSGDVLRQRLTVNADYYLPVDRSQIPLGPLAPVEGTPFDFHRPVAIGARIRDRHEQLAISNGYDHYWMLNKPDADVRPTFAVWAIDLASGRTLDCSTTEPGVQIYAATFFDGYYIGIVGRYGRYAAFTLETQHYPDSPNHPSFPTTELAPGQVFDSTTVFRFGSI